MLNLIPPLAANSMEALLYLRSFLVSPDKVVCLDEQIDSGPESISMTTLAGLPSELLLCIFDFLPVVDLLCVALCCRNTSSRNTRLYMLCRRQMSRLEAANDDKSSVLRRLERDHPTYFACDFCGILHRFDGSDSFGLHKLSYQITCPVPCLRPCLWSYYYLGLRTHYNKSHLAHHLVFPQVKLAMKRFHYGPTSGVSTRSLGYTQVRHLPPGLLSLFSKEAQICPEPFGLYIRMQDILVVKTADDLVPGWSNELNYQLEIFEICAHIHFFDFIFLLVDEFQERGENLFSSSGMCSKCNTEYCLQIAVIDSKVTLIMTRWINLGHCLSPEDILWRAHTYLWLDDESLQPAVYIPAHLMTSPRQCFEETAPQSYEDLQSHNLAYLKNQQYKKLMRLDTNSDVYWVPYEESLTRRLYKYLCGRFL